MKSFEPHENHNTGHSHSREPVTAHTEEHSHHTRAGHGHSHGSVDASILTSERGIWALRWSFVGLFVTALVQIFVFYRSRSVGLLADTIHNFGDAATAVPLWIAFTLSKRRPSNRFPYGLGRVEDLAGIAIVAIILFSGVSAGYESIHRFFHPVTVTHLYAVMTASIVGFLGNEGAAIVRIRVGKEIESAALIADGRHARIDGFASLAVLAGAVGVKLGYPVADPIVGIIITVIIGKVVWDSGIAIFSRMLDGIDPALIPRLTDLIRETEGVENVGEVRARWLGHRLIADVTVGVSPDLSVEKGHEIAAGVQTNIQEHLPHVASVTVHVDPSDKLGEHHHHRDHPS